MDNIQTHRETNLDTSLVPNSLQVKDSKSPCDPAAIHIVYEFIDCSEPQVYLDTINFCRPLLQSGAM